jgi:hypothetical protein
MGAMLCLSFPRVKLQAGGAGPEKRSLETWGNTPPMRRTSASPCIFCAAKSFSPGAWSSGSVTLAYCWGVAASRLHESIYASAGSSSPGCIGPMEVLTWIALSPDEQVTMKLLMLFVRGSRS